MASSASPSAATTMLKKEYRYRARNAGSYAASFHFAALLAFRYRVGRGCIERHIWFHSECAWPPGKRLGSLVGRRGEEVVDGW